MGSKKPKQKVADYLMSIHFGVAHAVDKILALYQNDAEFWSGEVSTNKVLTVDNPNLFGGKKKEGGVSGYVEVMLGGDDQLVSSRFAGKLGGSPTTLPGFRGMASLLFTGPNKGFYWGSNSPYLKPVAVKVSRIFKGLSPDKAAIYSGEVEAVPVALSLESQVTRPGQTTLQMEDFRSANHMDADGNIYIFENISSSSNQVKVFKRDINGNEVEISNFTMGLTSQNNYPHICGTDDRPVVVVANRNQTTNTLNGVFTVYDINGNVVETINCGPEFGTLYSSWYSNLNTRYYKSGDISYMLMSLTGGLYMGKTVILKTEGGNTAIVKVTASTDADGRWSTMHLSKTNVYAMTESKQFICMDRNLNVLWKRDLSDQSITIGIGGTNPQVWVRELQSQVAVLFNQSKFWKVTETETVYWGQVSNLMAPTFWMASIHFKKNKLYFMGETNRVAKVIVPYMVYSGYPDLNPAHIIYECLTNTDWGLGIPTTMLDLASFESSADVLYGENFGMSLMWTNQSTVESFINDVLAHIDATYGIDPATGKIYLKLIRADYDLETLPSIDDATNCRVTKFSRKSLSETTNEVVVTWTNPINEQEETVAVHDLANYSQLGQINSASSNYYGIRNANLALRCAMRDLAKGAYPVANFDLEVNRSGWNLKSGDVVKLTYQKQGIIDLPVRIMSINYGKPGDMKIAITAIEDVFDLPASAYVEYSKGDYPVEDNTATPMTYSRVMTTPYYIIARQLGDAEANLAAALDNGYAMVLAAHTNVSVSGYDLTEQVTSATGTLEPSYINTFSQNGRGLLTNALPNTGDTATLMPLTDFTGSTGPSEGMLLLITDGVGANNELCMVKTVNTDGSFVVTRACLDTVHKTHPAGAVVWIIDPLDVTVDETPKIAGQNATYRLLTRTVSQVLAFADAPDVVGPITERAFAPYRPGNVKINGVDRPTAGSGALTITWSHRNRLLENPVIVEWSAASVTPEPGTTYEVRVWDSYDTGSQQVLAAASNLTDTTVTLTPIKTNGSWTVRSLTVGVWAVRGGVQSHEIYTHALTYTFPGGAAELEHRESRFLFFDPTSNRAVFARTTGPVGIASPTSHWWVDVTTMAVTEKKDLMLKVEGLTINPPINGFNVVGGRAFLMPLGVPWLIGLPSSIHYNLSEFYAGLPATTVNYDGTNYPAIDVSYGPAFPWNNDTGVPRYPVSLISRESLIMASNPASDGIKWVQWLGSTVLVAQMSDLGTLGVNRTENTTIPAADARTSAVYAIAHFSGGKFYFSGACRSQINSGTGVISWLDAHIVVANSALTTFTGLRTLPISPVNPSRWSGSAGQLRPYDLTTFNGALYFLVSDLSVNLSDNRGKYCGLYRSVDEGQSWVEIPCPSGAGLWPFGRLAVIDGQIVVIAQSESSRSSFVSVNGNLWVQMEDTGYADLSSPSSSTRLGYCTPTNVAGRPDMSDARQWPVILPGNRLIAMTIDPNNVWLPSGVNKRRYWLSNDGGVNYTEINVS